MWCQIHHQVEYEIATFSVNIKSMAKFGSKTKNDENKEGKSTK